MSALFRVETRTLYDNGEVHSSSIEEEFLSSCLSATHKFCNVFFTDKCNEEVEKRKVSSPHKSEPKSMDEEEMEF